MDGAQDLDGVAGATGTDGTGGVGGIESTAARRRQAPIARGEPAGQVAEGLALELRQRLVSFARSLVDDRCEAEDIAQEVLLRAGAVPAAALADGRPDSWLLRVCRHVAIDHLRSRRVRAGVWGAMPEDAESLPCEARRRVGSQARPPRTRARRPPRRPRRTQGLSLRDLPPAARLLMSLHYERGLSQPTLCRLSGLSTSALRVRLYRARGALQKLAGVAA